MMSQSLLSRFVAIGATLLLALMVALPLLADATTTTTTRGKITAVSATSITVQPRGGGDAKTFTINAQTTITLDGKTAAATDLAVDQRASVDSTDGTTATAIKARTPKKPAPAPATP